MPGNCEYFPSRDTGKSSLWIRFVRCGGRVRCDFPPPVFPPAFFFQQPTSIPLVGELPPTSEGRLCPGLSLPPSPSPLDGVPIAVPCELVVTFGPRSRFHIPITDSKNLYFTHMNLNLVSPTAIFRQKQA